jgi:hypothetical protein
MQALICSGSPLGRRRQFRAATALHAAPARRIAKSSRPAEPPPLRSPRRVRPRRAGSSAAGSAAASPPPSTAFSNPPPPPPPRHRAAADPVATPAPPRPSPKPACPRRRPPSDPHERPFRETPAPHVRPTATATRRPWRPLELFADHAMAARLWCLVAVVAVTGFVRVAALPRHPRLSHASG